MLECGGGCGKGDEAQQPELRGEGQAKHLIRGPAPPAPIISQPASHRSTNRKHAVTATTPHTFSFHVTPKLTCEVISGESQIHQQLDPKNKCAFRYPIYTCHIMEMWEILLHCWIGKLQRYGCLQSPLREMPTSLWTKTKGKKKKAGGLLSLVRFRQFRL